MSRRLQYALVSWLASAALASAAWAGVFKGPGYYVVVSSSYVVSGTSATGYQSASYYGPIEGPYADAGTCETRRKARENEFKASRKSVLDGNAFFMCNRLDEPMTHDSGEWWNPKRGG
jgi:hypothetical protein